NNEFTKCFPSLNKCLGERTGTNSIYYNENLKKCWNGDSITNINNYFLKKVDTNLIELVNECEFYYYKNDVETSGDNHFYCITDCKTSNPSQYLYFIRGNKKCLTKDECYAYHKYYYDPDNNECIDTCKGRPSNKFQKELSGSTAEECLSNCPFSESVESNNFPYHNFDSNICLKFCGADGSNNKYHKQIITGSNEDKICYPSCADIPGGTYIYKKEEDTTNNVYTCYSSYSGSSCAYYYYENDGSKK
ncbi:MAG: hypothetical protein J6O41_02865, partial [Clostridia bacterium]|nr:hypothetical protein [Clostridia bacterium]